MSKIDELRSAVAGTNIDEITLLSTDFFNSPNEAIMIIDMVADMPELLSELKEWRPKTYVEHFQTSFLPFAELAIKCYEASEYREQFDHACSEIDLGISMTIEELARLESDDEGRKRICSEASRELNAMVVRANSLVHAGTVTNSEMPSASTQADIDALFG